MWPWSNDFRPRIFGVFYKPELNIAYIPHDSSVVGIQAESLCKIDDTLLPFPKYW